MRDVATLAGVGLKTVSRVVNREPDVSDTMAARVEAAIATLGYRHNLGASSLRRIGQATMSLGLVLEDVSNPFSSALHRAIEDSCRQRGYLLFAGSSDEDLDRERDLLLAFSARRVDGLIVVSVGGRHHFLEQERRVGMHVVYVDRQPPDPDNDSVVVDNVAGARAAVAHLIAQGHRRIGFLGDNATIPTAAERFQGYSEELRAHGSPVDNRIVVMQLRSRESAESATQDLMRSGSRPTALFTAQNLITLGAVRALQALHIEHRIALVGFDDFDLADMLRPAVTVVAQDPRAIGRAAADIVFRRISGDNGPTIREVLGTRLIPRGSGEIAPPA